MLCYLLVGLHSFCRTMQNKILENSLGDFWVLDIYKCPFLEMSWTLFGVFYEKWG